MILDLFETRVPSIPYVIYGISTSILINSVNVASKYVLCTHTLSSKTLHLINLTSVTCRLGCKNSHSSIKMCQINIAGCLTFWGSINLLTRNKFWWPISSAKHTKLTLTLQCTIEQVLADILKPLQ